MCGYGGGQGGNGAEPCPLLLLSPDSINWVGESLCEDWLLGPDHKVDLGMKVVESLSLPFLRDILIFLKRSGKLSGEFET